MKELFMTALRLCLSASIVLAVVLLLRLLFAKLRAPKILSLCLWALVGLRLLIPAFPSSSVSLVPPPVGSGQVVEQVAGLAVEKTRTISEGEPVYQEILSRSPQIPVRREAGGSRYVVVSARTLETPKTVKTSVLPVLAWLWAGGTVLMLGYMLISFLKLRHQVKASIRQADNIYRCDQLETPFILGLIRPRIYLPTNLNPTDEAYVLAHEQAHLKRLDHIWKPLGFFLLSLYWFNPLFWLGYILLCRDIEGACDEKVVKAETADYRKAYSLALVNCSLSRRLISACPLAFGETGVPGRVKSVLHYKKPAFWMLLAALLIGAITAGCALTNGKGSTPGGSETAGPESNLTTEAQTTETPRTEAVSTEPVSTEPVNTEAATTEPSSQTESSAEKPVTEEQEDYYSFVLFGVDARNTKDLLRNTQGDTCVLVTIHKPSGEIRLVSFDRHLALESFPNTDLDYAPFCVLADAYNRYGAEKVLDGLNRSLDLHITDYLVVNWNAVADVIDLLGGVDLELTTQEAVELNQYIGETMNATGREKTPDLNYTPGRKHLDGVQAVAYERIRYDTFNDNAIMERQQKLIGAVLGKIQGLIQDTNIEMVMQILNMASLNMRTNMGTAEITYFLINATKYSLADAKGFPFQRHTDSAGFMVFSGSLEEDVRELHRFLYDETDYEPSEEIGFLDDLHKAYIEAGLRVLFDVESRTFTISGSGDYESLDLNLPDAHDPVEVRVVNGDFSLEAKLQVLRNKGLEIPGDLPAFIDRSYKSLGYMRTYLKENAGDACPAAVDLPVEWEFKYDSHIYHKAGIFNVQLQTDIWHRDYFYLLSLMEGGNVGWEQMGYAWYVGTCLDPYSELQQIEVIDPASNELYSPLLASAGLDKAILSPEQFRIYYDVVARYCFKHGLTHWGSYSESMPVTSETGYSRVGNKRTNTGDKDLSAFMAASFVAWLDEQYGPGHLASFVFGQSTFQEAFGTDYDSAFAAWKAWIMEKYPME